MFKFYSIFLLLLTRCVSLTHDFSDLFESSSPRIIINKLYIGNYQSDTPLNDQSKTDIDTSSFIIIFRVKGSIAIPLLRFSKACVVFTEIKTNQLHYEICTSGSLPIHQEIVIEQKTNVSILSQSKKTIKTEIQAVVTLYVHHHIQAMAIAQWQEQTTETNLLMRSSNIFMEANKLRLDAQTALRLHDGAKANLLISNAGKYSKRRRSNVAVIIVRVIFISSFLLYCLLFNHSFPTNPNRITNCFNFFSHYNFTTTLLLRRFFDF